MDVCGKRGSKKLSGVQSLYVPELRKLVRSVYQKQGLPVPKGLSRMTRTELCQLLSTTKEGMKHLPETYCDKMGGLSNFRNSCYLDSLLVSILHKDNKYINSIIRSKTHNPPVSGADVSKDVKALQDSLKDLKKVLKAGTVQRCIPTRVILSRLNKHYVAPALQQNFLMAQLSPEDVWNLLMIIFANNHQGMKITKNTYALYDDGSMTEYDINNAPYTNVQSEYQNSIILDSSDMDEAMTMFDNLIHPHVTMLDDANLFRPTPAEEYNVKIDFREITDAPFLHFYIRRGVITAFGQVKDTTEVTPDQIITTNSGKKYSLSSIVVHLGGTRGGHYIAYISCKGMWYRYDDLGPSFTRIGGYDSVMELDDVRENCTNIFYL